MYKIIFATVLGIASFLSFVLLAFAFRDFSFILFVQFIFTLAGLCLSTLLLTRKQTTPKIQLKHWFVARDEKVKQHHAYIDEEEENEEFDLEDKFSIGRH